MQFATAEDIPALTKFYNHHARRYQFAPVLEEEWLHRLDGSNGIQLNDFWLYKEDGEIKACMAAWDQRAFKQTVVHGYRFPLSMMRGLYNLFARILGWISLPPIGNRLQQVYLSFLAINEDTTVGALALVKEGLFRAGEKEADVAVIGLSEKNPLLKIIMKHLPCHAYRTCIELIVLNGNTTVDVDARPPQPDVAVL